MEYIHRHSTKGTIESSEMGEELRGLIRTLFKIGTIYIVGIVVLSVFLSHKIVGPLNGIKKILLEIQETGDFDREFTPRKNDELYELLSCLHNTFKKLQEDRLAYRTHRQEICEKIKEIADRLKANPKQPELLSELEQIAETLKPPGTPR